MREGGKEKADGREKRKVYYREDEPPTCTVVMIRNQAVSRKLPWTSMMLSTVSMHCKFFTVSCRVCTSVIS